MSEKEQQPSGESKDARFKNGNKKGFASHPENINRGGRPKVPSLTAALLRRLNEEEDTPHRPSGKKIMNEIVDSLLKEAIDNGSYNHLRELWVRVDGKGDKLREMCGEEPTSKEEHRVRAIELYRAIVSDPNASHRDKLTAQASLNELLGLMEDQFSPTESAQRIQQAMTQMLGSSVTEEEEEEEEEK